MHEFIFTFGFDHINPITGKTLFNNYVRISAEDSTAARVEMNRRFGNRWSSCYPLGAIPIGDRLKELKLEW